MNLPPEVVFHRFFQGLAPSDRELYRGKADLVEKLQEHSRLPVPLLENLQKVFNGALANAKPAETHAKHGILYCDYVDSEDPNALAFEHDGFAFIGITIALVNLLAEVSLRLSTAQAFAAATELQDAKPESVQAFLLRHQLMFILGHEWAHHVQGTVPIASTNARFSNEVFGRLGGSLLNQVYESSADGYAIWHSLSNILDSDERARVVPQLGIESLQPERQDKVLQLALVGAVAGFVFAGEPCEVTSDNVRHFSHPPQAVRMAQLLNFVRSWSSNFRPSLQEWLSPQRFGPLFRAVATATWGLNGAREWDQQLTFIRSTEGQRYEAEFNAGLNAHVTGPWHRPS